MRLSYFLSERLSANEQSGFTKTIVRLAILTVALSVIVLVIGSTIISGFKKEISERVFNFWGHIHVTDARVGYAFEPYPFLMTDELRDAIYAPALPEIELFDGQRKKAHQPIKHIQTTIYKPAVLKSKSKTIEGIVLKGIGEDYDLNTLLSYLTEGSLPPTTIASNSNDIPIMLSEITARRMSANVNDKVIVTFVENGKQIPRRFQVCGIYSTGLEEFDKKLAVVPIAALRQINDWQDNAITTIEIFTGDLRDLDVWQEYLYFDVLPSDLYAISIKDKFPGIFQWLSLQDNNEWFLMVLMLIVAVVNLATVIIILIVDRTEMIGVLKALGARNAQLQQIFMVYGLRIAGWGLLIGNVVGIGLALLQKYTNLIKLDESHYYLDHMPIDFNWPFILLINAIILGTLFITLWIPSWIAGQVSPLRTIRWM